MRKQLIALGIMLHFAGPVPAEVSFGFGFQTDNVSISLSSYPNLVRVPGYPVYYASGLNSNYFFYDGMYWIFEADRWYSSEWYNGPWSLVGPEYIPVYLLRVPVRYYRRPPAFFVGWQANSPPRWGEHWGNDWARQRSGWDRWNRQAMPAPAPLPTYQRKYSGDHYPAPDQQPALRNQNYRHEARDPLVRQQLQAAPAATRQPEPMQRGRTESPPRRNAEPAAAPQRPVPSVRQEAPPLPPAQRPQRGRENPEPAATSQPEPMQRGRVDSPPRRNAEPAAAPQRPVPSVRQEAPPPPPEQKPQRVRENPEPQRQAQPAPRVEERPAQPSNPQPQREMNVRPQAEPAQQHAQPPNEVRPAPRPAEPQNPGQKREQDNSEERGQGRGR